MRIVFLNSHPWLFIGGTDLIYLLQSVPDTLCLMFIVNIHGWRVHSIPGGDAA